MDLVQQYEMLKASRLAKKKETDDLEKKEKELKQQIIDLLRAGESQKLGASASRVTLDTKDKPVAEDWPSIWQFIKDNDAFDLLQKRLTETAVLARWQDGITIKGINSFPVYDLKISKE